MNGINLFQKVWPGLCNVDFKPDPLVKYIAVVDTCIKIAQLMAHRGQVYQENHGMSSNPRLIFGLSIENFQVVSDSFVKFVLLQKRVFSLLDGVVLLPEGEVPLAFEVFFNLLG